MWPVIGLKRNAKVETVSWSDAGNILFATDPVPKFQFVTEKLPRNFRSLGPAARGGGTSNKSNSTLMMNYTGSPRSREQAGGMMRLVDQQDQLQNSSFKNHLLADRVLRRPAAYDRHLPLRYRPPTDFRRAGYPSLWAEEQAFLAERSKHSLADRHGAQAELIDAERPDSAWQLSMRGAADDALVVSRYLERAKNAASSASSSPRSRRSGPASWGGSPRPSPRAGSSRAGRSRANRKIAR